MKKFYVEGTYKFHGQEITQRGFLDVDDRLVTGRLIDNTSVREVAGSVVCLEDRMVLNFTKPTLPTNVPWDTIPAVYYHLEKPGKDIEGLYEGKWSFNQEITHLGIGYVPERGGEVLMFTKEKELENEANLILIQVNPDAHRKPQSPEEPVLTRQKAPASAPT